MALPVSIEPLLAHLPVWAMVLFRLTGIFVFAPVFGSRIVPRMVKVFLALGLSFCIYPMLLTPGSASAQLMVPVIESGLSMWSLLGTVASELLIGLVIGFGATLPLVGMQIGGRVIDQQMGLGLAGVLNPEFGEQTGIISEFFATLAMAIFLILGGHQVVLITLIGSFQRIPLGGFWIDGPVLMLLVGLMTTIFDMALRIAAPLLCLIFLETIAMGFIARTVPQMNILSIGFALRIVIGAVLLVGSISLYGNIYATTLKQVLYRLSSLLVP